MEHSGSLVDGKDAENGDDIVLLPVSSGVVRQAEVEPAEDEETSDNAARPESPLQWIAVLWRDLHWSFVVSVVVVYGISQGLGGSLWRIAGDFYWKDVQKVQPSAAQVYHGITNIPWMIKPLWGILTDVLPLGGYRRRPYLIFAGLLGVVSMLVVCLHSNLHILFALLTLTAGSAGVAIADVTIDACIAENSINFPALASEMQSLCGCSSSIGSLIGFAISGLLVHAIGSQGALGTLSIPAALVFLVGIMIKEDHITDFPYKEVHQKLLQASRKMLTTLKCPVVWRPCVYMYTSLALSLNIQEGMFFWYTDPNAGPAFSEGAIGFIFAIGSVGYLFGVLLYQYVLKEHPFRRVLLWSQFFLSIAGMLDLVLVLRLNLKLGLPDYLFAVIDESASRMVNRIKWMPLLVLSSKLCPTGIEGTFFALLMSIDNIGLITSSWLGGLLLHLLQVTRTDFHNLWAAILIRNATRLLPLALLFLVPMSDQNSTILPAELLAEVEGTQPVEQDVEMYRHGQDCEIPKEAGLDDSDTAALIGKS